MTITGARPREFVGRANPGASPRSLFAVDSSRLTAVYDVPWNDRTLNVMAILGFPEVVTRGAGRFVTRNVPDVHPDFQGHPGRANNPFLWATRITDVVGLGVPADRVMISGRETARYLTARLTVQYDIHTYDIATDGEMIAAGAVDANGNPDEASLLRYVTKIVKPKGRNIGVTAGAFFYAEDPNKGQQFQGSPPKLMATTDLTLIWHQVPLTAIPQRTWNPELTPASAAAADDYLGHVNSVPFANQPAGTVLYLGADVRAKRSALGDRIFDVEYHFDVFSEGHNKVPRVAPRLSTDPPTTPPKFIYTEVSTDGQPHPEPAPRGVHIYNSADLNDLFRVPAY